MFPLPGPERMAQVASAISAAAELPPEPAPWLIYSPQQIGELAVPNRIIMAAMATGFASPTGLPTPRLIAWYAARASGGAGLIILEACSVGESAAPSPGTRTSLRLSSDDSIPAFAALVTAIHGAGARVAIQLNSPAVSNPSELPGSEIVAVIEAFGHAAARARAAGFDAVQIQCAYESLLRQLLSPASNQRGDKFGRGPGGRLRATLDVLAAVRAATRHTVTGQTTAGASMPVLVKLSADEHRPHGLDLPQTTRIAQALVRGGAAAIEVVAGDDVTQPALRLSAGVGEATQAELAAAVKDAIDVPVLAAGRIISQEAAEKALRDGQADLIALGRALLADPAWLAKARAGLDLEIIPCIGCLACFVPAPDGGTGCLVNGDAGREYLPALEPARRARRVTIIGASLPGLELARIAATRGHNVEISTAGLPLGGLLGLRAGVPGNAEFGRAFLYFGDRLRELGVGIVDEPAPDADVTVDCRPAPEMRPHWANGKSTLLAGELLGRDLHEMYGIGRRVAVAGLGALAAEVAIFLAGWGRRPTVVVPGPAEHPFPDVHPMHATRLLERLEGYRIALVTDATPVEWIYDEENRKSTLRVRQNGIISCLTPFHSAVSVAGWPPLKNQRGASTEHRNAAATEDKTTEDKTTEDKTTISGGRRAAGPLSAKTNWPSTVKLPKLRTRVLDGGTLHVGDTPYAEPLRDLVAYAHLLARRL